MERAAESLQAARLRPASAQVVVLAGVELVEGDGRSRASVTLTTSGLRRVALGEHLDVHGDAGVAHRDDARVEADDVAHRDGLLEVEGIHRHGGHLDLAWRIAGIAAAAMSTIDMIQPPNTSPDGLRAGGIGITCSTMSLSVGSWQAGASAGASAGIRRLVPSSPTAT